MNRNVIYLYTILFFLSISNPIPAFFSDSTVTSFAQIAFSSHSCVPLLFNELEHRLLAFQRRYEETASPFQWTFTRKDLATLLAKIENKRFAPAA
jgi:hypothetical protein